MKKLLIPLLFMFFIIACGGGGGEPSKEDSDLDGIPDISDEYPFDTDNDGIDNDLDEDDDNDGVPDAEDAFPYDKTEWLDTDGDGKGNNLDADDDNDGTPDTEDIFPLNKDEQGDADSDGIGNNADADDDNDGIPDNIDTAPYDPAISGDIDGDGKDNLQDDDDDGDGYSDALEIEEGSDPLDAASTPADTDGDGLTNKRELFIGTDPNKADSDSDGLKDPFELEIGSDPMDPDTDGDLKEDGKEYGDILADGGDYDGDGVIDVMDFNNLIMFATENLNCGEISDRYGVAWNNEGDLALAQNDTDQVIIYSIHGERRSAFGSDRLNKPNDIAVDSSGNYYVANTSDSNIAKFNGQGVFQGTIGEFGVKLGEFSFPRGIAVVDDYLYVADTENNRIQMVRTDGSGAFAFGTFGQANGQFSAPVDVAADNEHIYVADRGNYRVQKFKKGLPPAFVQTIDYLTLGLPEVTEFEPVSVAAGPSGAIYILNINPPYVSVVSKSGTVRSFGEDGKEEGKYICPSGIEAGKDDKVEAGGEDKVLIGETYRMQVF